ncbi:hypothetical protein O6H91_07G063700 [Diphasiastrum complanatum]|nr:hypothetical protein O6H91_07G063700 [Diphasiastrum complanatum]
MDCNLLKKVQMDYGCNNFICLGGFRNIRNVYVWEGLQLELDETQYEFGTTYEIECETDDPERARQLLGDFLNFHNVPFSFSTSSKFAILRSGAIPA